MSTSTLELIACQFSDIEPATQLINELIEFHEDKTVALADALIATKDETGRIISTDLSDINPMKSLELGSVIAGLIGKELANEGSERALSPKQGAEAGVSHGLSQADIHDILDQLKPGDAAALILIEHSWAAEFQETVTRMGGKIAIHGFLENLVSIKVEEEIKGRNVSSASGSEIQEDQPDGAMASLAALAANRAMQEETAMRAAEMLVEEEIIDPDDFDDAARITAEAMRIEQSLNDESS